MALKQTYPKKKKYYRVKIKIEEAGKETQNYDCIADCQNDFNSISNLSAKLKSADDTIFITLDMDGPHARKFTKRK